MSRQSNRVSAIRALRARFPLEMISPKNDDSMNSTLASRPENRPANRQPHAAPRRRSQRAIATDDAVRVFNERGQCILRADVRSDDRARA